MKRDSNTSIIPKIIVFLGTVSILGIFWLFFSSREQEAKKTTVPETTDELFTQVISAALPEVKKIWQRGDLLLGENQLNCPDEIEHQNHVGKSYYQCQPHFWQCYWQGGVKKDFEIKVELFDKIYHVVAVPAFDPISQYSKQSRFYQTFKGNVPGLNLHFGYIVKLKVKEIDGFYQSMVLTDVCRDVYLPERIYGYGKAKSGKDDGFIWDNFGRRIFIDKFYVPNQQVNEWRYFNGEYQKMILDRKLWPYPALLNVNEQIKYCAFHGKRLLEAKLFDAASMAPVEIKNTMPEKIIRPQTPWQRDLSKTFLGMAKINPDYQLTPLDCDLAQVKGCEFKLFSTDSASWMGMNFAIGFYPESFRNPINPQMNLKMSSRLESPSSDWHELGARSSWDGIQTENLPAAFRCYEEVVP